MLCRELLGEIFMTRDKTEGAFRLLSVSPSSPLLFPSLLSFPCPAVKLAFREFMWVGFVNRLQNS